MPGSSGSPSCRAARLLPLSLLLCGCSIHEYEQRVPAGEDAFECSIQALVDLGYDVSRNDPDAGIIRAAKSLRGMQDFLLVSFSSSNGVVELHVGAGSGDSEFIDHIGPTRWVKADADSVIARCGSSAA